MDWDSEAGEAGEAGSGPTLVFSGRQVVGWPLPLSLRFVTAIARLALVEEHVEAAQTVLVG